MYELAMHRCMCILYVGFLLMWYMDIRRIIMLTFNSIKQKHTKFAFNYDYYTVYHHTCFQYRWSEQNYEDHQQLRKSHSPDPLKKTNIPPGYPWKGTKKIKNQKK